MGRFRKPLGVEVRSLSTLLVSAVAALESRRVRGSTIVRGRRNVKPSRRRPKNRPASDGVHDARPRYVGAISAQFRKRTLCEG